MARGQKPSRFSFELPKIGTRSASNPRIDRRDEERCRNFNLRTSEGVQAAPSEAASAHFPAEFPSQARFCLSRIVVYVPTHQAAGCRTYEISLSPFTYRRIIMYKTVRKGDASLQYTILPQTDQFSSSGFPQTLGKPTPRFIKYTVGTLMVLFILSCVATPFLMNQNDHNLFAGTVLAMGRVGHSTAVRNSSRTKEVGASRSKNRLLATTASSMDVSRRKGFEDATTSMPGVLKMEESAPEETTSAESLESTTQRAESAGEISSSAGPTTIPSSLAPTFSSPASSLRSSSTERMSSSSPRKPKMPRVTLKLRENETIPQMYMKAGIASYKKGNITTSVLAHGLSLEGLIFKTPEGTIKPWPQKWFFTDPSSDFQWKGSNQMPVTIYIVLAGLAALASVSMVLMFYVQRKASRRQRQSVEEPEVEGHEEDKSTLLGADNQETEEKEGRAVAPTPARASVRLRLQPDGVWPTLSPANDTTLVRAGSAIGDDDYHSSLEGLDR
ncbi:hypothetical protein KM043_008544 [Ampulex compressa]|nr:hypothetical protein KM043_008544 [Ampulex compressa]